MARNNFTFTTGEWIAEVRGEKIKVREDKGRRQFTVRNLGDQKWRINGISSDGSRVREQFACSSLEAAVHHGVERIYGVVERPGAPVPEEIEIAEAMDAAIRASHAQERQLQYLRSVAVHFLKWADDRGLRLWRHVRRTHIDGYVNMLIARGVKRKTIQNYLEPVRMTGARMAENSPEFVNPTATFRLPSNIGQLDTYDPDSGSEALSIAEVMELAEWLRGYRGGSILRCGVLLAGLMGMRQMEIVYLT